jgi:hypothetical protein
MTDCVSELQRLGFRGSGGAQTPVDGLQMLPDEQSEVFVQREPQEWPEGAQPYGAHGNSRAGWQRRASSRREILIVLPSQRVRHTDPIANPSNGVRVAMSNPGPATVEAIGATEGALGALGPAKLPAP